jgi:hypothetical protein
VVDVDGKVHQVRCKVCNKIEGKEKLLPRKLKYFWKQDNRKKTLIDIRKVYKVGDNNNSD